jgi:hypothetical protein
MLETAADLAITVVPRAADGQSADRSRSLQPPLLLLKAGPAGGASGGRPGVGTTATGEPASPSER